jgi:hypothetical protein
MLSSYSTNCWNNFEFKDDTKGIFNSIITKLTPFMNKSQLSKVILKEKKDPYNFLYALGPMTVFISSTTD